MQINDILASIPPCSEKRLAVRVTPDAVRQIKSGHPWVYDNSITKLSPQGSAGDFAVIFDRDRSFIAIGLYDPDSPIRIKVLHSGKPRTIDTSFWSERLQAALALREPLAQSTETTAYRCLNGENDGFPGLIVDRYNDTYVLKLYTSIWFPHLKTLLPLFSQLLKPESLVLRLSRNIAETFGLGEGETLLGTLSSPQISFKENGLIFKADVLRGHKTGHFLDQRDNRSKVRKLTDNAKVLDVFCCNGGFSLYAAAGGAKTVIGVDQSVHALNEAEKNFALNDMNKKISEAQFSPKQGDAFAVMTSLVKQKEKFDVVVIDPPSFAQKKSDIGSGISAYKKLTTLGSKLVRRNGYLIQASCSSRISETDFRNAFLAASKNVNASLEIFEETQHAIDHPVRFQQGSYLKAIFAKKL